MARAFLVRPFGEKEGINFDFVEQRLIQPALAAAGIDGQTTGEIVESGNIRQDMFRLLVTADLVVADLSIHNANVFYELGIRHGLRPHGTLLIRAEKHSYPFDLQTDRYLRYDAANPQASIAALTAAIRATLASSGTDSPVYKLLPNLPAPSPAALRTVPPDFTDAVEEARAKQRRGDLRLLAHEAAAFEWGSEGLRAIGRAQVSIQAWGGACDTFELLRQFVPSDVEAQQQLVTIYQRLGDLVRSSRALQALIDAPQTTPPERAEACALKGRNAKARWVEEFEAATPDTRRMVALRSPDLADAIESYALGFEQDLNHFYSGLNALGLLCVRTALAHSLPDVWEESFETAAQAAIALDDAGRRFAQLASAIDVSIAAREAQLDRRERGGEPTAAVGGDRMWAALSRADHAFLTAGKPQVAAARYREATKYADEQGRTAVRRQLAIFAKLGVRQAFLDAAVEAMALPESELEGPLVPGGPSALPGQPDRVILFTGHLIDRPGRPDPRFPPTAEAEAEARRMIREAVIEEQAHARGTLVGVAGAACGGDILFHEVCEELGVHTAVLLALPVGKFSAASVQYAGGRWVERYDRLCAKTRPRVLSETGDLPAWLRTRPGYDLWQRNNLWLLFNALAVHGRSLTLLALWDRGAADGPGGTEDLVAQVRMRGHKDVILPAERLKTLVGH